MTRDRQQLQGGHAAGQGRLQARAAAPELSGGPGLHSLALHPQGRETLLFVPDTYERSRPAPLALMFHGAGGHAHHGLDLLRPLAEEAGLILLAPASRRQTWDIIVGRYGPDVLAIDQALAQTFARYAVDPARVAIGGFSDGASYALSLGITNGDLFTHIVGFSPGFFAPGGQHGAPQVYISHGTRDQVLPIHTCSRRLVPELKRAGYHVHYHEFDGPHTVPPQVAQEAVEWFLRQPGEAPR